MIKIIIIWLMVLIFETDRRLIEERHLSHSERVTESAIYQRIIKLPRKLESPAWSRTIIWWSGASLPFKLRHFCHSHVHSTPTVTVKSSTNNTVHRDFYTIIYIYVILNSTYDSADLLLSCLPRSINYSQIYTRSEIIVIHTVSVLTS